MPAGTCDPASRGQAFNEMQQVEGSVEIYVRYGWDGTSVKDSDTGCDGPISLLRGTNTSATETWYAHFQGRKGTWIKVPLAPGETRSVSNKGALSQIGLVNRSDLDGLYITNDPNPPQATLR